MMRTKNGTALKVVTWDPRRVPPKPGDEFSDPDVPSKSWRVVDVARDSLYVETPKDEAVLATSEPTSPAARIEQSIIDRERLLANVPPASKLTRDPTRDNDPVNRPAHYTYGGIEVIDALEAWDLPFHLANAVKYIARAGRKDPTRTREDLQKAVWYISRYIEKRLK
jgi:hypothetical protein